MEGLAHHLAAELLSLLGSEADQPIGTADHPALAWRRAGLMDVTGLADGPGLVCPVPLASAADAALLALRAIAPAESLLPMNGALLLGERARLLGLGKFGRMSPNQSCRLIEGQDGHIALNLAREDDWDLAPILFGVDGVLDWPDIENAAAKLKCADMLDFGIELGLPIARHGFAEAPRSPFKIAEGAVCVSRTRSPLVLDFSSLWAGPLVSSLLGTMGAHIFKIESTQRLDGLRYGHKGFFDLLNAGKQCVTFNFKEQEQMDTLHALVARADIVIEGSRPRALRQLGIVREDFVALGGIWTSITAHDDPVRVGFGDDASVAGGVSAHMEKAWGEPLFAGDAIADPLTGLYAALATWHLWRKGASGLVELSLAASTAFAATTGAASADELRRWQELSEQDQAPLYPLRLPIMTRAG